MSERSPACLLALIAMLSEALAGASVDTGIARKSGVGALGLVMFKAVEGAFGGPVSKVYCGADTTAFL